MLFTDTDICSLNDLSLIDSNVISVAGNNSIILGMPGGHMEAAQMEVGELILANMQSFADTWFDASVPGVSWNRYDNAPLPRIRIGQIVVDDTWTTFWSPIKRAVAYKALIKVYSDASGRMKEDIYDKKITQWEKAFRHEWSVIKRQGIPIVYTPVPAPAAKYEPNSGTWDGSQITAAPLNSISTAFNTGGPFNSGIFNGANTNGGVFDVTITYSRAASESYCVGITTIGVPPGNTLAFDITWIMRSA